jgi:hypothetical protein
MRVKARCEDVRPSAAPHATVKERCEGGRVKERCEDVARSHVVAELAVEPLERVGDVLLSLEREQRTETRSGVPVRRGGGMRDPG